MTPKPSPPAAPAPRAGGVRRGRALRRCRERALELFGLGLARALLSRVDPRCALGTAERIVDITRRDDLHGAKPRVESRCFDGRDACDIASREALRRAYHASAERLCHAHSGVGRGAATERDDEARDIGVERGAHELTEPVARGVEGIARGKGHEGEPDGLGALDDRASLRRKMEPAGASRLAEGSAHPSTLELATQRAHVGPRGCLHRRPPTGSARAPPAAGSARLPCQALSLLRRRSGFP